MSLSNNIAEVSMKFMDKVLYRSVWMLLIALLLTSCIYITNNINDPNKSAAVSVSRCDKFVMPDIKHIPNVPVISDAVMQNRDKTDTILVDKIAELRTYSKDMQKTINEAYAKHLATCK